MDLQIKHTNGEMLIHMEAFFPITQAKFKKPLDVVDSDVNAEEHIKTLQHFFKEKVAELKKKKVAALKSYEDYRQKVFDQQEAVRWKYHNGKMLSGEQLKQAVKDLKRFQVEKNKSIKNCQRCISEQKKFLKYIEILEQRK